MRPAAFAWKVCKHVKSNAIMYAKPGQTVGIGAGQMSRVDSVKLAVMKAQMPIKGCVMASDAFFPFRDGLDAAMQAGLRQSFNQVVRFAMLKLLKPQMSKAWR